MRKIIITIYIFFSLILSANLVLADDISEDVEEINLSEIIETVSTATNEPKINSRSVLVFERSTGRVLYDKNGYDIRPMASTTKIMTSIIVLENTDLSKITEVSKKAANIGGSQINLKSGDKVKILDLLYGLMLKSGNDAAIALAEEVAGSVEDFAEMMNKKAEELGLEHTHFVTPHGLDSEEHYTTAHELAKLADYALKNETFKKIVGTRSTTININGYSKTISTTNELLGNLNGVYGVKTGFTNGAGRCLVTSTLRNNMDIICVVLGSDTKKIRTTDSIKLIEYSFSNYKMVELTNVIANDFNEWKEKDLKNILVEKSKENVIDAYTNLGDIVYPLKAEEQNDVQIEYKYEKVYEAPLEAGTKLGEFTVKTGEEIIYSQDIMLLNTIEKKGIIDYIYQLFAGYKNYLEQNIIIN